MEAAYLLLLEDNLVEQVLKVLVGIVDAQLFKAVEAQVLPGRWRLGLVPPWSANPSVPTMGTMYLPQVQAQAPPCISWLQFQKVGL